MFSVNLTFDKTLKMQFCYFSAKIAIEIQPQPRFRGYSMINEYFEYRVCQKRDTPVNYVNITSYKLKNTRYLHRLYNFNIHYYWSIHRVVWNVSTLLLYNPSIRRRRHSSMLRSMKRCDNLFYSSTIYNALFQLIDSSKFSVMLDLLPKSTPNSVINGV